MNFNVVGHLEKAMDRDSWNAMIINGYLDYELDWLAVDNKVQLGIFTSLLDAQVPHKVKASYENYENLRQRIESTPKTTFALIVTRRRGILKTGALGDAPIGIYQPLRSAIKSQGH